MLDVILVSNYSMKEELEESLKSKNYKFHDLMIQDINHIERYPIDNEYKTIIIQSANAIKILAEYDFKLKSTSSIGLLINSESEAIF